METAIDDFVARCWTSFGASEWNVCAMNYFAAAVRRRSLAPVGSIKTKFFKMRSSFSFSSFVI
jgi:hypothetical protein